MLKKLLVAVLLLWVATLVVPGLDDRLEPRRAAAWGWVEDRLEVPLTPVRNRYYQAQVRSHLDKTQRALVMSRNQGMRALEPEALRGFMARHDIVPDGLDPWGTPYLLVQQRDSLRVVSAGPDQMHFTEDDMSVSVFFPARDRRRPFQ